MDRSAFSLALLALLAATTAQAPADDTAGLGARVSAAMQSARSFVVTTTASTGFSVTLTFVAPDRYRSTLVYRGTTRSVVLIGSAAYVGSADGVYRKTAATPQMLDEERHMLDVPVERVLADRIAAGTSQGQFATTSRGVEKDQHMICRYDKHTYRLAECSNEGFTMIFSRYDDPANVVTVPANVAPEGQR